MKTTLKKFLFFSLLLICVPAFAQFEPGSIYTEARSGSLANLEKKLPSNISKDTLNNLLDAACAGNNAEVVRFLIKKGADVNHISSWGNSLLMNALMLGRFQAAEELINAKANIKARGYETSQYGFIINWDWTPLMAASYKGGLSAVTLLLKKGAKINDPGWSTSRDDPETATDVAAYSGHLDVLTYLQKKGGKLSPETIFKTARGGHPDIIEMLLKRQDKINALSKITGRTLLMEACWWGKLNLVDYLIKKGADPNAVSAEGYTALAETIRNADGSPLQTEILKYLLEHGADPNKTGQYRMTPLMLAVWHDQPGMIKLLVQHGAK
jgi:ankyrin repeat protein